MPLNKLDERLSVGPQIAPDEVAALPKRGFRSILCERPGDEDPGQPSLAGIAAAEQGRAVRPVPVTGRPAEAQAAAFARALREPPGPTYAHCRSGGPRRGAGRDERPVSATTLRRPSEPGAGRSPASADPGPVTPSNLPRTPS